MATFHCLWVLVWGLIGVQADFNCTLEYDPRSPMRSQLAGNHFVIPFDEDPPYSTFTTGNPSGFSVQVLREIARRGNFTFSVTNAGKALPGEDSTQFLKRMMTNADMFGSYWTDTSDRRAAGALFSAHYVDVTRLLVTLSDDVIPPEDTLAWTFLKPFRWDMWLTIAAGCAVSGLVTYWFEMSRLAGQGRRYKKALAEAKGVRWKTLLPYLLRSYGHFSGSGHNLEARTVAGRLHNVVWAFLVLIIFSAYLANLASFLVIQTNRKPLYQNINALVSAKQTLCTDPTDSVANMYLDQYRNLLRYPSADEARNVTWITMGTPHESLVQAMKIGKCAGVILRASTLDILQSRSFGDRHCDLVKRDPLSTPFGAGFGFAPDRCGPYMLAVIDSIMVEMQTQGRINELWKQEVPKVVCDNKPSIFSVASVEALNVDSFAGLFYLYLAFVGGALILRISRKLWVRVEKKVWERLRKETASEDIDMSEVSDTAIPVTPALGSGTLDERVTHIDREMADILFSLRQLSHAAPVHDAPNDVDTPPARASAATLS